ncbi:glycosyltransferase [Butyrivibrio sp. TB]|uniref:glycosyltransferase n=1 Tax=Butyrivibrio sp. TB TaxID=1520809 RepID=UPI0008C809BB|nr:glycosyltransferase [Butyrivibrio sp. TB]SEP94805.1 Glycosyl transferases group 1 [Butyrivibrio sp. TB]
MKIGIEICDNYNDNKDFTHLEKGNPGIGGIYYQMLLMGDSLLKFFGDKYEIVFFHYNSSNIYPVGARDILCDDNVDLLEKAEKEKIDALIVNCNKSNEWYSCLRTKDTNVLVRAGCYFNYDELKCIRNTPQVVRVITISSEEYDYYYDEDILEKTICIENSICFSECEEYDIGISVQRRNQKAISSHNVAYIGSIVPQKGFARLAKIWTKVVKKIPDAHLYVIGSGQLYDSNAKLGKYGIAEEKFEASFMKYLCDSDGNILSSVTFCGLIMGGYSEAMSNISVGVVNPIALTETFCTSAIDFASYGIPVVTCGKHGLLSTVINRVTGITFLTNIGFRKALIRLMLDNELNKKLGDNAYFFARNFDWKKKTKDWDEKLQELRFGYKCEQRKLNGNYFNDFKWFKVINRFFRKNLGLTFLPTAADYEALFFSVGHFVMDIFRKLSD